MKRNGKKSGSDLVKAAGHVTAPHAYEELPILTDEMLAAGVFKRGGKLTGRPHKENKKVSIHLRIDPDIREAYKATGRGWQSRMNAVLRAGMHDERV